MHAPHCAIPHPNFVPVNPSTSRKTQSSGISSGASTSRAVPLTFSRIGTSRARKMLYSPAEFNRSLNETLRPSFSKAAGAFHWLANELFSCWRLACPKSFLP